MRRIIYQKQIRMSIFRYVEPNSDAVIYLTANVVLFRHRGRKRATDIQSEVLYMVNFLHNKAKIINRDIIVLKTSRTN